MVERAGNVLRDEVFSCEVVSIGRDPERDIVLDDPIVSGLHLVVKADANEKTFRYIDQSANGTWISGRRVDTGVFDSPVILHVADFEVTLIPVSRTGTDEQRIPRSELRSRETTLPGTVIDDVPDLGDQNSAELRLIAGLARPDSIVFSDKAVIGRSSHCDIICSQPEVSRQHVELERSGNEFRIRRLSGRNTVEVNGKKLPRGEQRTLTSGDLITFVGHEFVFFRPARSERRPARPEAEGAGSSKGELAVYERASVQTDIVALDVIGFLGAQTAEKFESSMRTRTGGEPRILVDLGYLAGIDPDGIRTLVKFIRDAEDRGARVQLIRVPPRVAETFMTSPLFAVLGEHISGNELSGVRKLNSAEEQR